MTIKIFSSSFCNNNNEIRKAVLKLKGHGKPIVVYGPQACGKTRNTKAIAEHVKRPVVIDDYSYGHPLPAGCVAFTNEEPPWNCKHDNFKVVNFSDIEPLLNT